MVKPTPGLKSPIPFLFVAIFLASFMIYILTLDPSLFRNDSPETITACYTLGIPHPPGYPLHDLLGRLFGFLSIGNRAMTLNLFSAFLGSLGAFLLAANLRLFLFGKDRPLSQDEPFARTGLLMATALSFAFSSNYWSASLSAKGGIYILQMVLELAFIYHLQILCSEWAKGKNRPSRVIVLLFFFALGLVNHWPTQLLLLPGLILITFLRLRGPDGPASRSPLSKTIIHACTIFLFPMSLYLYLPLRSRLFPHLNFDAPFSIHRFMGAVLRTDYSKVETMASATGPEFHALMTKTLYLSNFILSEFNGTFLLFVILGILFLLRDKKSIPLLFLLTVLSTTLFANILYLRVHPIEFWHLDDHMLGTSWILGLLGGYGFFAIGSAFGKWPFFRDRRLFKTAFLGLMFLAPPLLTLRDHFPLNDQRTEFSFRGYGLGLLKSTARGAYYLAESDFDYFSILYLQEVEGRRPDLRLILESMLARDYEPRLLAEQFKDLGGDLTEKGFLLGLLKGTRPIYCAFSNGSVETSYSRQHIPFYFRPAGLAINAFPGRSPNPAPPLSGPLNEFWERYLRPAKRSPNPINGLFLELCAHPYINWADYLKLTGDLTQWEILYGRAISLIQENPWLAQTWDKRAEGELLLGNKGAAVESYITAARNYGRMGDRTKAYGEVQKARALFPQEPGLRKLLLDLGPK